MRECKLSPEGSVRTTSGDACAAVGTPTAALHTEHRQSGARSLLHFAGTMRGEHTMPSIHYIEHTRTEWPDTHLGDTVESTLVFDLPNDTGVRLGLVDLIVTVGSNTFAVSKVCWEHGAAYVSLYGRKLRKDGQGFRGHYNEYLGACELFR